MKKEQYQNLLNWKCKRNKKPLIIFDAKQVGKTNLVNTFKKMIMPILFII